MEIKFESIKKLLRKKLKTVCDRCTKDYKYPSNLDKGLCRECYIKIAKRKYDITH